MFNPYEHELKSVFPTPNSAGRECATDCPACRWSEEQDEQRMLRQERQDEVDFADSELGSEPDDERARR